MPNSATAQRVVNLPNELTNDVDSVTQDRRCTPRLQVRPGLTLTFLNGNTPLQCQTQDLSEGGLFVRLPQQSHLSVGQRCELSFTEEASSNHPSNLSGLTCYATVVRTHNHPENSTYTIGAGLRFDRPLFL